MIADLNCGGKVRRHIPIVEKVRTAGPGLWAIFLDSRRKIPLATLDRQLRAATSEGVQSLGRRSHFSQRTREVGHSGFMDTSEVCGPAGHGYVAGTTVTVRLAWKLVATPLQV
jgi:hypothetical protein